MLTETGSKVGIKRRGVGGVVVPGQWIGVHVRLVRRGAVPQSSVVLKATGVADLQRCLPSLSVVQPLLVFETIPPSLHYAGYLRGDPRVSRLSVFVSFLGSREIFAAVPPEEDWLLVWVVSGHFQENASRI